MLKPRRSVPIVRVASEVSAPVPALQDLWATPQQRSRCWRYWFTDPLVGGAEHALFYLCRMLPLDWCSALGALHGRHIGHERRTLDERALNNLRRIRPDLDTQDRIKPVLKTLRRNAGRAQLEALIADRLAASGRITVAQPELFEAAVATGRSLMFVAVHTGNLGDVLGASLLNITGYRGISTTRPCGNRFRRSLIDRMRSGLNAEILPPGLISARRLLRHLKQPRSTALMHIDEARGKQVHFPSFGRSLPFGSNLTSAIRLTAASNGLLMPVYLARTQGTRFCLHAAAPIDLQGSDDTMRHQQVAEALNTFYEDVVRRHIDDWQQMYYLRMA